MDGVEHTLRPRSYLYPLLLLARARIEDAGVAESDRGWLYNTQLTKMLGASRNQVYVNLYRARKALADIGIVNNDTILERRSTTRQVRLGPVELSIASL